MASRTVMVLLLVASATAVLGGCKKPIPPATRPELGDFGPVPAFELTTHREAPLTNATLAGKTYVVNTFFASCRTMCPPLMAKVAELSKATASLQNLRFVSITVDPDNDTPAALAGYAAQTGITDSRWHLATAPYERIHALVVSGFRTAVGKPAPTGPGGSMDITHTGKLMLVDGRGHLRGYFGTDVEGIGALTEAIERLEASP